jgi:D-lyxose ketol-isomerase
MTKTKWQATRRDMLTSSLGGAFALIAATPSLLKADSKTADSKTFYQSNGAFRENSAKQAYHAMMRSLGYPISDVLKTDEFWVCDFLQRDFANVGLGGVFWAKAAGLYGQAGAGAYSGEFNDEKFGYTGIEIFLLPGQIIPEHRHLGGSDGYGPKMESWLVRYGSVEFFGEYQAVGNETPVSEMAERDRPWGYGESWFQSRYVTTRTARSGQVYSLVDPESWHFMRAGKDGAIVTEFANCHNHVEFSKPGMEFVSSTAR